MAMSADAAVGGMSHSLRGLPRLAAASVSAADGGRNGKTAKHAALQQPNTITILRAIYQQAQRRRTRFDDALADYDKLNTGIISESQLRRALATQGVSLTDADFAILAAAFAYPDQTVRPLGKAKSSSSRNPNVNYRDFLSVLTLLGREGEHRLTETHAIRTDGAGGPAAVHDAGSSVRAVATQPDAEGRRRVLAPHEELLLTYVNRRILANLAVTGADLRQPFTEFDKLRRGRVTVAQFERCVPLFVHEDIAVPLHLTGGGEGADGMKARGQKKTSGRPAPSVKFSVPLTDSAPRANDSGSAVAADSSQVVAADGLHPVLRGHVVELLKRKYGDAAGVDVHYSDWCDDVEEQERQRQERPASAAAPVAPSEEGAASRDMRLQILLSSLGDSARSDTSRPVNGSLTADQLMAILRHLFAISKLRCEDYFRDFDKKRTGLVTPHQFTSVLGRLPLRDFSLTEEHLQVLLQAYCCGLHRHDAPAQTLGAAAAEPHTLDPCVNYILFLADVMPGHRGIFGGTAIKDPSMSKAADPGSVGWSGTNTSTAVASVVNEPLPPQLMAQAVAVLERVRAMVSSRRINLKPVFHDFDRARKGIYQHRTCTASRFERALVTNKVNLSPLDAALLVELYRLPRTDGSRGDEVNYHQFMLDVDPTLVHAGSTQVSTNRALPPIHGSGEFGVEEASVGFASFGSGTKAGQDALATSLEDVLAKLTRQAADRELRADDFFIDFDPLRSGVLQKNHFISALGIAGFHLRPCELELLCQEFRAARVSDHVDATQFIAALKPFVDAVMGSQSTKRHRFHFTATAFGSTGTVSHASEPASATISAWVRQPQRDAMRPLSSQGAENAKHEAGTRALLDRLAHIIRTRQLPLESLFSDSDKHRRGKISLQRFEQALSRQRISISKEELYLLGELYACHGEPDMIDYRQFIRDSEAVMSGMGQGSSFAGSKIGLSMEAKTALDNTASTSEPPPDLESVLLVVCRFLQERQARLSEFFPDGDELRHGRVSSCRFRHCLSILGLALDESQLRVLESAYADVATASSCTRPDVVYPKFLCDVELRMEAGVGQRPPSALRKEAEHSSSWREWTAANMATSGSRLGGEFGSAGEPTALEDVERLQKILAKISSTIRSYQAEAAPALYQHDKMKKGRIRDGQFFSALALLGVRVSPEESRVLSRAFCTGGGEVNYAQFLHAIQALS